MDKRFFLALALSALVIVLTQMIFPQPKRAPLAPGAAVTDTVARQGGANRTDSAGALAEVETLINRWPTWELSRLEAARLMLKLGGESMRT